MDNLNTCCPSVVALNADECGLDLSLSANAYVARVCQTITYTLTLTNNTGETLRNVLVNIPLVNSLTFIPGTLQVGGNTVSQDTLDCISVGDMEPTQVVTLTFNAVVMNSNRYIKTQACAKFICCCCCMKRTVCAKSNQNCVQVCQCCQSSGNTSV